MNPTPDKKKKLDSKQKNLQLNLDKRYSIYSMWTGAVVLKNPNYSEKSYTGYIAGNDLSSNTMAKGGIVSVHTLCTLYAIWCKF